MDRYFAGIDDVEGNESGEESDDEEVELMHGVDVEEHDYDKFVIEFKNNYK